VGGGRDTRAGGRATDDARDDARLVAVAHLHELRQASREALVARAGEPEDVAWVTAVSGRALRRVTRIRSDGGDLRVLVRVDDGRARGRVTPLAEERVLVTPDGHFVREWTPAGESPEARRHVGITPAVQLAGVALAVLLLVAFVLLA
jgi:hypothetical protein